MPKLGNCSEGRALGPRKDVSMPYLPGDFPVRHRDDHTQSVWEHILSGVSETVGRTTM